MRLSAQKDLDLELNKTQLEGKLILQALSRYDTMKKAAQAMGISRTTLWRKMSVLDIKPKE